MTSKLSYGDGDASFQAAGGLEGLEKLSLSFYAYMDRLPSAVVIRAMHPEDLDESVRKLAFFLSGWLGGPKHYSAHYGPIRIPAAHQHLAIGHAEADAWIECMQYAVDEQPYAPEFKVYLIQQLRVPAERIRQACLRN
ncbi:group II truncated hemoglobin [Umboniibacter marinipuniceus]|uniref:Hemoglobin n=1 Tax=Umboniibacter marinipuniceus TaxID=569599 RepID=A0A3M0A9U4_9GAMM|nr:group II truncated hemoglobin [Umboniibacter marinipuniceus]RMA81307.1 hemoglobin [Umboniibacter marinipuniceus]